MFSGIGLLKALKSTNVASMTRFLLLLLKDEFTTAEIAPIVSPRTCEPGPGTLTVVDTGNIYSISSDTLVSTSYTTQWSNPRIYEAARARVAGLAAHFRAKSNNASQSYIIGWNTSAAGGFGNSEAWMTYAVNEFALCGPASGLAVTNGLGTFVLNTYQDIVIVLRGTGSLSFLKESGVWKLLYVQGRGTATPLFAMLSHGQVGAVATIDRMTVSNLSDVVSEFGDDYGLATNRISSPVAGTTTTMIADGHAEITWIPVAAETLELDVRRTDADNRWIVRCSQSGSTIKLIERTAGVDTERSSAAQTFTVGSTYRIMARANGTTIKTFVAEDDKSTYTLASNHQSATGVQADGFTTASNLATWPYEITGSISSALNELIA